jgi:hypothetical protein
MRSVDLLLGFWRAISSSFHSNGGESNDAVQVQGRGHFHLFVFWVN